MVSTSPISPGDFLGEMGIVSKTVRNATVVTTSPSHVIDDDRAGVPLDVALNPAIAGRIDAVEERCRPRRLVED